MGDGEELREVLNLFVAASKLVPQVVNLRIGTRQLSAKMVVMCPMLGVTPPTGNGVRQAVVGVGVSQNFTIIFI